MVASSGDTPDTGRQEAYSAISDVYREGMTIGMDSLWRQTAGEGLAIQHYPTLEGEVTVEVAIVGAGITGMTTAILLQKAGYDVAVVDAYGVGDGVSAFNSGHLTSMMLDMEYSLIVSHFGEAPTRMVALALQQSIDLIERLVGDFRIDCDFKRLPGYLYAERFEQSDALRHQFEAAAKVGLPVNLTMNVPLPFAVEEGVLVENQARFHPFRYVRGLAQAFHQNGGHIFERSRAMDVSGKEGEFQIKTEAGLIFADNVVIATHTPIGFRPVIQSLLEPMRSYVIGIRTETPLADALYWDMDKPYHYIRLTADEQGPLVLIGGADHKSSEPQDAYERFRQLEHYAGTRFDVSSVDYHWAAQFYDPADGLPYVGQMGETYIATGFSGEGLTCGTLAAQVIADQIQGIQNDCGRILSPTRGKPIASAGGVVSEGMSVASHFIGDRLRKAETTDIEQISPGEGRICNLDGTKAAAYRSPSGVIHVMSPVCTHMGCIVDWNNAEKTWDCPCHGGRFDPTGKVLNGPPVKDLKPLDLE